MGVEDVGDGELCICVEVVHNKRRAFIRLEGHLGRRLLDALILCAHNAKVANRHSGVAEVRVVSYDVNVAALHVHPNFFAPGPVVWVVGVRRIIDKRSPFNLLVEAIVGIVTYINFESLEPVLVLRVA